MADQSVIERHLHTFTQIVIIAILLWFGNKTIRTSDIVIRLEEQVSAIRADILNASSNRYTINDAASASAVFEIQIRALERRINKLEVKVE